MNKSLKIAIGASLSIIALAAFTQPCSSIPKGISAVKNFEVDRYLGKWYEIARFDFRYEKNMSNVTAQYSLLDNGKIKVVNRGFDTIKSEWKQSNGVAKFAQSPDQGMLKVSFFRPFYSGYNIVKLDTNYQYALVVGESRKYMWILSRTPHMPEEILQEYIQHAQSLGLNVEQLVFPTHEKNN